MFGVVEHVEVPVDALTELRDECGHERFDRPVAFAVDRVRGAVDLELCLDRGAAAVVAGAGVQLVAAQPVSRLVGQVLGLECVPHHAGADLRTGVLGDVLDGLRELDLQTPWQVETVLGLHHVGDATLAGLAVHADHGFVRPSDVRGIDGEVRDAPLRVLAAAVALGVECLEPLLDRVLVAAGERGVHEVAGVGVARVHRQAVAILGGAAQLVDVTEVEFGVDAVHEQVHRQGDDVDVAGALTVAEQRALDPVGAGHHAELGGCHRTPAIIVRVQRDDHRPALLDRAAEPLDHVAVDVGGVALDRRRQVQHDRAVRCRLDDVHDGFAHLDRELGLGEREALRRVLVTDLGVARSVFELAAELGAVDCDVDDARLVEAEHDLALQRIGGVVEVHDRSWRALDALIRALDQLLAALYEHLDRDVVGDAVLLDQLAHEVEIGLAGGREPDLDLLESHRDQFFEHAQLAGGVHGIDERLVAVAQVDRAPQRGLVDRDVRPGAVGEHDRHERRVLLEGHRFRGDILGRHRILLVFVRVGRCSSGSGPKRQGVKKQEPPGREGGGCGRTRVCGARPT